MAAEELNTNSSHPGHRDRLQRQTAAEPAAAVRFVQVGWQLAATSTHLVGRYRKVINQEIYEVNKKPSRVNYRYHGCRYQVDGVLSQQEGMNIGVNRLVECWWRTFVVHFERHRCVCDKSSVSCVDVGWCEIKSGRGRKTK